MKPTPILFMSDAPAFPGGLSRITRDLAMHACSLAEFRVASLGRGDQQSSKLPFMQYTYGEDQQWGEMILPYAWDDFAGAQPGIAFTVWDLSRLGWFTRPRMGGALQDFLLSNKFKKWGYIPVDHYGVGGKLTSECADTLRGYDRILAYTLFGKQVLEDTLQREVDWIPHGINGEVWTPRDPVPGRMLLGVREDEQLVGCVMTNQSRKDWGTAFGAIAGMATPYRKFWCHTDTLIRYWNLLALAKDFGVESNVILTTNVFTSEELSYLYSACNVTFLPSLGEGFGYPIVESLACGVPVVHGDYGGGVEFIPEKDWLVAKAGERLDGQWNCVRPILDPRQWAAKVEWVLTQYGDGSFQDICRNSVEHLFWRNLWKSCWSRWFLEGLQ